MTNKQLEGRVALVTGASRGIGAAVAKRFAAEGAHVIALARTCGALEALDDEILAISGSRATLVPMDVCKFEQIDQLGGVIATRFGKLDILVGNAGVLGTLSPLAHVKPKTWQNIMDINVTANWRLIRSMDTLLRASDAGRAIFVTSGVTEGKARAYWGAYAASKAALEVMVRSYAAEMENTPVRVNLLDPGRVRTNMRKAAYPGEDPMILPAPEEITDAFIELAVAKLTETGAKRVAA